MSLLVKNTTPAERLREAVFSENFVSNEAVVKNNGTISGTPVINFGAELNGTTDFVTYTLEGNEIGSDDISFVIEFKPNFEATDNSNCFFDSGAGNAYFVAQDAASQLRIDLGNTTVVVVASATYAPFWLTNQRNVLVISGTSGDTNVWLNGNQIVTNDPSAWTPEATTTMFIGALGGTVWEFDGTINSLKIFNSLLTTQEALDFYNNDTYNYRNRAVVDLPMGSEQHDPSNQTGTNILVDGDMEAVGVSDWTSFLNAALTKESGTRTGGSGTQVLKVRYVDNAAGAASQGIVTAGKTYRYTGWAKGDGDATAPRLGQSGNNLWTGDTSTDWQFFDITAVASGSDVVYLRFTGASDDNDFVEFDDVVVEEFEERTLDVSGNDNYALLGDGSTPTTFPTKLTKHGYSFDGGDYLNIGAGILTTTPSTLTMVSVAKVKTGGVQSIMSFENDGANIGGLIFLSSADFSFSCGNAGAISAATYPAPNLIKGNIVIIIGTHDGTNTSIWVNGEKGTNAVAPLAPNSTSASKVTIGARTNLGVKLQADGEVLISQIYDFALTPLQVQDLTINLLKKVNDV